MKKLKLEMDALKVESFDPAGGDGDPGTVRGYLTAYYELCYEGDTWQNTCTCEPTCNAQTCYQCPPLTPACPPPTGGGRTCTSFCCLITDNDPTCPPGC